VPNDDPATGEDLQRIFCIAFHIFVAVIAVDEY
jgi:hypothetical protein